MPGRPPFASPSLAASLTTPVLRPLALAISLALGAGLAHAADALPDAPAGNGDDAVMQTITVTGKNDDEAYTARKSASASKLDLSLRETPQSVSVVTRAQMDDFKLDNASKVLAQTTGVTVEAVETDRSYYTARGYDITNFQYDGVGIPFVFGNVMGDLDTAVFERVDVVRGANGLISSTGNPSATINFVRKRPVAGLAASAAVTVGSWDTRRFDADVSTPLSADGKVAARFVVVHQEGNSYLDRYSPQKDVVYGIVEAKLTPDTTLTVGNTYQKNQERGGMWGALPLSYTDGTPTNYPISTSTSANWSRWNIKTNNTFAELVHQFNDDWSLKSTLTYTRATSDSKLLYVYGTPDRATGDGLFSYPSAYNSNNGQALVDISANGKFMLGGRKHDITLGLGWSKSTLSDTSYYGRGIGTPLPNGTAFDGSYPEPVFDASTDGSSYTDKRKNAFVAARFNLADNTKLLAGFNTVKADSTGTAYGVSQAKSQSDTTPYAGLVYDINRNVSAYGSYTGIFNPQSSIDARGQTLAAATGKSLEAGLKSEWFDGKLNLSGAVFKTRQDNAAEAAGTTADFKTFYKGVNSESKGLEFDVAGELARGWQANAGYSQLRITGDDGQDARTFIPRKQFHLATTYRVAGLPALKVGASLTWQDAIYNKVSDTITLRQGSYAQLGLLASYDISRNVSLSLNLNNVTDNKHLTSLYWTQALYAPGRNGSATLSWKY
ncbi:MULTISPECIES: TonB-dependent siderophore receptor [unclassified Janthinobacterium]|uniref:TonB-dependent siderophore receptor n=1 Tax=unclassified Janthinobacterium TaxID=2610881 RepID=UPI00160AB56A|nr:MULTISPECIES: TonB-dependent siderophore receptor [unclassified Janthinobacterium]MBB5368820.1 outer membrane receptor for ferric coprogen and ferric-rhodotorulic acid [Janthinobacterium sp. K2C7]MBB5381644.1 outer membrane receptor for ferric coprogen and ferric-rhodotorulic acid [Janthinobacterium sp. K2Li3]MBB5387202.1 outer membrane receptor for ferric coprogen and ferric-rhodotorulic acid [Janthinobacterium sp. K2E3]